MNMNSSGEETLKFFTLYFFCVRSISGTFNGMVGSDVMTRCLSSHQTITR